MKTLLFFSFLLSVCHGGIWICSGLLVRNHFETILSMILRKPVPENMIDPEDSQRTKKVIDVIGLLLILIGIGTMIIGLTTMITGLGNLGANFNFKY